MLRFKLFHSGAPVTLSDSLPMLEHMGFKVLDEHPHRITPAGMPPIWMHDFGIAGAVATRDVEVDDAARGLRGGVRADLPRRGRERRLQPPGRGRAVAGDGDRGAARLREVHAPDRLPAVAGVHRGDARRASGHRAPAGRAVQGALRSGAGAGGRARAARSTRARSRRRSSDVENLSEDRVLRAVPGADRRDDADQFLAARRRRAARAAFLSFKFDPAKVPGLPEPKPMFEIFVYSTRFEGVHLRGGKVARGGLRWSDRPEDFRTEVLGLVKAQMVKNTVIVPVGSKGGFVLKRAPPAADREAFMKEGVACYQDYLRGLLDLTDNRVGDRIVPPPQVKRHDADDPYLVVAADKGTATFSDYANAVSDEYGFWLGDAFASGGSVGYDHKAMGITARGAWESVKRHFREHGRRHPDHRLHGRRHRRHVGRRVRQRHAAVAAHQARRRVRPPPHLPRSEPGSGDELRRARAPVQAAALDVGRLRRRPHLRGRRHPSAQRQVDPDHAGGQGGARDRRRRADADRARQRHPQGAGRPALQRRHRHLREGDAARRTRRSATAPTTRCA